MVRIRNFTDRLTGMSLIVNDVSFRCEATTFNNKFRVYLIPSFIPPDGIRNIFGVEVDPIVERITMYIIPRGFGWRATGKTHKIADGAELFRKIMESHKTFLYIIQVYMSSEWNQPLGK